MGTSAWYAPGAAAAQMVESIIKDENRIYPCAVRLSKLGKNGVTQILELKLNAAEKKLLKQSAKHVEKVIKVFSKMKLV